jgi:hypothetical protein
MKALLSLLLLASVVVSLGIAPDQVQDRRLKKKCIKGPCLCDPVK